MVGPPLGDRGPTGFGSLRRGAAMRCGESADLLGFDACSKCCACCRRHEISPRFAQRSKSYLV